MVMTTLFSVQSDTSARQSRRNASEIRWMLTKFKLNYEKTSAVTKREKPIRLRRRAQCQQK